MPRIAIHACRNCGIIFARQITDWCPVCETKANNHVFHDPMVGQ